MDKSPNREQPFSVADSNSKDSVGINVKKYLRIASTAFLIGHRIDEIRDYRKKLVKRGWAIAADTTAFKQLLHNIGTNRIRCDDPLAAVVGYSNGQKSVGIALEE